MRGPDLKVRELGEGLSVSLRQRIGCARMLQDGKLAIDVPLRAVLAQLCRGLTGDDRLNGTIPTVLHVRRG